MMKALARSTSCPQRTRMERVAGVDADGFLGVWGVKAMEKRT